MRQGGDIGTQYRSAIYTTTDEQLAEARASREAYQAALTKAHYDEITTEIVPAGEFYPAEDYHQQYLAKVPNGYCGLGGTGVSLSDRSSVSNDADGGSCAVGTGVGSGARCLGDCSF